MDLTPRVLRALAEWAPAHLQLFSWWLLTVCLVLSASLASLHAVMTKHDERAAVGWIGVICLVPGGGPLLYWLFGINRIRRKAVGLGTERITSVRNLTGQTSPPPLHRLQRLVDRVVETPLLPGNTVTPLIHGAIAYPAMLAAINAAQRSVTLCSYIFDHDAVGQQFRAALVRAQARGVEVRVLIDAVGARYSWPSMARVLKKDKVRVALFGRTVWPWRMPYANLRNHRKILMIDGAVGFTGGMNLRGEPIEDVHFQITGPVLAHMWQTLAQDWQFTTGERLVGPAWQLDALRTGATWARGVVEGPDENIEKLHWVLLGALACAEKSVYIVTPYFLPDQVLITALNTAALRGVEVHILVPQHNNLALVQWASTAVLPHLMGSGCQVHEVPGVFAHTKMMLVDDQWALVGSANWDPRSIRLNFEFNLECYDVSLVQTLRVHVEEKLQGARLFTSEGLAARTYWRQVRDNIVHLASPYL